MKRLRFENGPLDRLDLDLIAALAEDARIPTAELARRVGLSAPSTAERTKRLEEAGVIRGYRAEINPAALGLGLAVYLRVRPVPGQLARVAEVLAACPEIVECDRVTGEDCFFAKAHLASVLALEALIDRINPYAMTNTSVIQSSPVKRRLPPIDVAS